MASETKAAAWGLEPQEKDKTDGREDPGKEADGSEVLRQARPEGEGRQAGGTVTHVPGSGGQAAGRPQPSSSSLTVMRRGQMRRGSGGPSPRAPPR